MEVKTTLPPEPAKDFNDWLKYIYEQIKKLPK